MRYVTLLPVVLLLATSCVQEDLSEFAPINEIEQPAPPVFTDPYTSDDTQDPEVENPVGIMFETEQMSEGYARQEEPNDLSKSMESTYSASDSKGITQPTTDIKQPNSPTEEKVETQEVERKRHKASIHQETEQSREGHTRQKGTEHPGAGSNSSVVQDGTMAAPSQPQAPGHHDRLPAPVKGHDQTQAKAGNSKA